jgi:Transposase DDE domain
VSPFLAGSLSGGFGHPRGYTAFSLFPHFSVIPLESTEGCKLYAKRAGIEGTLSQGVRAFGLRRSRYIGLGKTHLQQVAIAAAMNLDRLAAWFVDRPRAQTRVSRFAALAA